MGVLGISALHARRADSEHLLAALLGTLWRSAEVLACTHLVDSPWRHEALSIEAEPQHLLALVPALRTITADGAAVLLAGQETLTAYGEEGRRAGAREAAVAHQRRASGRAVRFPGMERMAGDVPVRDVLAGTPIDRIVSANGPYDPEAVLATGGYLRPCFSGGELVLHVGHSDPARLIPWEVRNPTPCCGADHMVGPLDV